MTRRSNSLNFEYSIATDHSLPEIEPGLYSFTKIDVQQGWAPLPWMDLIMHRTPHVYTGNLLALHDRAVNTVWYCSLLENTF